MYRTPYRRAFKAADGTRMIELLDRTEIPLTEWQANIEKHRVVDDRDPQDYDPISQTWNAPQTEEPA